MHLTPTPHPPGPSPEASGEGPGGEALKETLSQWGGYPLSALVLSSRARTFCASAKGVKGF